MRLFRRIGPVRNVPAGTITRPPPALLQASIAAVMARLLSDVPPVAAP